MLNNFCVFEELVFFDLWTPDSGVGVLFSFCFLLSFFLYDNNGNNQRLRTNRELRAGYRGMVFNHFSR